MRNYCKLVPRTPPEGFLDWCREKSRTRDEGEDPLDIHGLVFEAEWVEEEGIAPMLEERKPRKIKMVHIRCTACGEERWVNWEGRTTALGKPDYGFLSIRENGCESVFDGDETYCPACGDRVIAKKAAKLGYGYHVSGSAYFLSAQLLPDRALALTGWCVERRFGRSGGSYLHAQPYDAYVFTATDCAKLTGWSKQYSGTAGYFRSWNTAWRQPQRWGEGWGQETDIFGLTPELVAESQLPHCKLYEYMTGRLFSPNASPAPIAYLRLCQAHPNVETLVTAGVSHLLDELMAEEMREDRWQYNRKGKLSLPEIRWKEKRPSAMLGLTREELRLARAQGWGQYYWRLYTRCLAHGEKLTEEDLRNIWYLGDENLLELIGRGPVGKSVRYLLRQAEQSDAWETWETDPDEELGERIEAGYLLDYWTMAEGLGYDLGDGHIRWPRDLYQAHEAARLAQQDRKDRANNQAIRERYRALRKWRFAWNGILIRPARSQDELNREGKLLRHCVATYGRSVAAGSSAIFFLRRASEPDKPWYTLELDEKTLTVRQNRCDCNGPRTPEVKAFEEVWVRWLRAGAPRDEHHRPIAPETKKKEKIA